jgi:large repetitive protein
MSAATDLPVLTSPTTTGSSSSTQPSPGPLSANVAASLQSLYVEYESAITAKNVFTPSLPSDKQLQISGDNVVVNLQVGSSTNFSTALSQLEADGMQVTTSSSTYGLIDGTLPIAELPAASQIVASVAAAPPLSMR